MRALAVSWLLLLLACDSGTSAGQRPEAGGDAAGNDGSVEVGGQGFTVLVSGRNAPYALALDAAFVYWIEQDGSIMRLAKSGGVPSSLGSGCNFVAIAVDAAHVYCGGTAQTILAFPLAGGVATVLAGAQPVADLAADGQRVYWTTYYGLRPAGNNDVSNVSGVGADGGAIVNFATMQRVPSSLSVNDTSVYWLTLVDPAIPTGTTVMRASLDGGAPVSVAMSSGASASLRAPNKAIALDGTSVYWSEFVDGVGGALRKAPLNGGPITTLAEGQTTAGTIAVDATNVYWVASKSILRMPLSGGASSVLVAGENAASIAVDDASVYWTNTSEGRIGSTPK
jgi:hypothetical protein